MPTPSQVGGNDLEAIQIPPTDIKRTVDNVARWMALTEPRNEKSMIADNAETLRRGYGFLYDGDIYHPYYLHQMSDLRAQDGYVKSDRIRPKWFTDTVAASASYQTKDPVEWYKTFAERHASSVVSPVTGKPIYVCYMFEHIQDPKHKEQKQLLFAKIREETETALAQDDEISTVIAGLARTHPEVFKTTEQDFIHAVKERIESIKPVHTEAMPEEPEPKTQRLDDDDDFLLVPEDEFLAQHPGPVCISVLMPKTRRKLEISVESLSESVSSFKEKIAREMEVSANKQMLGGKAGYFKDHLSLAYYNVTGGEKLFLWPC
ncbi:putative splicing factor 3A subunit 1 [Bidens hawaiensis]|uniref:putative splicing factor 3A subunit 1 n=1 Tax=Bidens hawaiensis TaxID=980011 RepID=UPI00404A4196